MIKGLIIRLINHFYKNQIIHNYLVVAIFLIPPLTQQTKDSEYYLSDHQAGKLSWSDFYFLYNGTLISQTMGTKSERLL